MEEHAEEFHQEFKKCVEASKNNPVGHNFFTNPRFSTEGNETIAEFKKLTDAA